MFDKDFQTQTDTKDQEKDKLTKLMEGFDDFYKGYNKENSDKQIANLLTSLILFINGEDNDKHKSVNNEENRVPTDRIVDKLSKLELTSIETANDEEDIQGDYDEYEVVDDAE